MIPLRDANPTHRTPYVTLALLALNVAAFLLWEPITGSREEQTLFFFCHGAVPLELTQYQALADLPQRLFPSRLQDLPLFLQQHCGDKSVIGSLFTAMFLHGSILHIAGNMLYLWIFGNNVEDRMGRGVFILFYLIGGVVATYAHVLTDADGVVPLVGASGAIAATLGAYIVMFPHARVLTLVPIFFFLQIAELPAILVLGFWFVLQAFSGVGSLGAEGGVAWFAHVGGFVFGALVALLFFRRREHERALPPGWDG